MMKKMLALLMLSAVGVFFSSQSVQADDQELYDPAPPADSAFVRLINNSGKADATLSVGGAALVAKAAQDVTAYRVAKSGKYDVALPSGKTQALVLESGKYYSLVLNAEVAMLEDALIENPAKSYLYFYNLSDAPSAALYAPAMKVNIIGDVATQGNGHRAVNALTIDMEVKAGDKVIKAFKDVSLQRRSGKTFALFGSGETLSAVMIDNNIE